MNHGAEAGTVVALTCVYTALLFYFMHVQRFRLMDNPLIITFVAFLWVLLSFALSTAAAFSLGDSSVGLFTTASWYSLGWRSGMSLFSVKINTWPRYQVVVLYQARGAGVGTKYVVLRMGAGGSLCGRFLQTHGLVVLLLRPPPRACPSCRSRDRCLDVCSQTSSGPG
jgi:hypothetical protein